MKIGIIGAGVVGRTIGKLAIKTGHQVMVSNSRGPRTLFSLRFEIGCEVGAAEEAAAFGDIVLLAIPLSSLAEAPVAPLAGKIVLDANNYYWERDGRIAELDRKVTTTSELVARRLPNSRIVKAFNAVRMTDLEVDGRPVGSPERRALPIAGDDPEGKAIAAELVETFGFDVVDAGALAEGWRFERDTPAYCMRLPKAELVAALASATR
jgi:8-hydroxy-5-deazaflavin:NADPH oxidoreductase